MTRTMLRSTLRHLTGVTAGDAELVQQFALGRDEEAFAEILRRHGPMVLGTCRAVLGCEQDAEDVFQATFLLLARKADAIAHPEAVAGWLHGVARRLSLRRREANLARQRHERQVPPPAPSPDDLTWGELRLVLHEEIERLPQPLRIALVLCYLEGLTQDEAAARICCPRGTLRSRLERGRKLLRTRLARRGLGPMALLSAAILPSLAGAAVSPALLALTLRSAISTAGTPAVEGLVREGLRLLTPARSKLTAWVVVVLLCCAGYAALTLAASRPDDHPPDKPKATEPALKARTDILGDPLPDGAVARLGTLRLRQETRTGNVSLSPDGKKLARAGRDGTIQVWDAATGKQLCRLTGGHQWECNGAVFSSDSKRLASCAGWGEVRVWDIATGKLAFIPEAASPLDHKRDHSFSHVDDVVYSHDGKLLAGMVRGGAISLWDASTGKELDIVPAPTGRVERLRLLTDGALACFVRSQDMSFTVHFLDTKTGKQRGEIRLTTPRKPPERGQRPAPEPPVAEPGFFDVSPDGSKIVGAGYGLMEKRGDRWVNTGVVVVRDVATGKEPRRWKLPLPAIGFAITPDSKGIAVSQGDGIVLLDAATGKEIRRLQGGRGPAGRIAFSADGKSVVTAAGLVATLIDVETGKPRPLPGGHEAAVDAISFSPDGKTIVTASGVDDTVRLWDSATGKETRTWTGAKSGLHSVLFSPDGKHVLAGGKTDFARRWDASTGGKLDGLPSPAGTDKSTPDRIYFIATSVDGKRLITVAPTDPKGDNNSEAVVYELPGYREVARWEVVRDAQLAMAPEGLLECEPTRVMLRDLDTGAVRWTFSPKLGLNEGMFGPCVISPDSRVLATGFGQVHGRYLVRGPRLRVWELASGKACFEAKADEWISRVAFSPDGQVLAAAMGDRTLAPERKSSARSVSWHDPSVPPARVYLWDLAQRKELARYDPRALVGALAFSSDGKRLATALVDTTALVWNVPSSTFRVGARLDAAALEQAWTDMASDDAGKAQSGLRRLAAAPTEAIPFLAQRLRPAAAVDEEKVRDALVRLDSARFPARRAALAELKSYGDRITSLVQEALKAKELTREKRQALEDLLESINSGTLVPERLRIVRSIQALEMMGGADARKLLELLAKGVESARETKEARISLARLGRRP